MAWDVFSIMGMIAFATSGAIVAMEEKYDVFGVFVLGFVTAYGGGILRNLVVGISLRTFWSQTFLFNICLLTLAVLVVLPVQWLHHSKRWVVLFDAIGLSAFAIQGALYAKEMNYPLIAIITAAVLTGIGGGLIRDLLAGRRPVVLREEVYAAWAMLAGLVVGVGWVRQTSPLAMYLLFAAIFVLRMISIKFNWRFPRKHWGIEEPHKQSASL